MKTLIVVAAIILLPGVSSPDDLVFHGRPFKRSIIREMSTTNDLAVSPGDAAEYEVKITKRGNQYLWVSRENTPLTLIAGRGVYIIFDGGAAGFIKLFKPFMYSMRRQMSESDRRSSGAGYVEVLHRQFDIFIYHGNEVAVNLPNDKFGMDTVDGVKDILPKK